MKLVYGRASPFVRKIMVQAHETGIVDKIELVPTATTPLAPSAETVAANPIKKIPALELASGLTLFDSPVICEYIDGQHDGARMFPDGDARWPVLRLVAAADGLMDAAILLRYETFLRPEQFRWDEWITAQEGKVDGVLADMNSLAGSWGDAVNAGTIAAACACSYLDFRFGDKDWRSAHPALASWHAEFSKRPSMVATAPE